MTKKTVRLPPELADVALIDAEAAAATGSISVSQWYAMVAEGIAPKPAIKRPRLTRYRVSEVAAFWRDFGDQPDAGAAAAVVCGATKASAAARAKRRLEKLSANALAQ